MDATLAVSEAGINTLLHKAIALAHTSSSDTENWGPFFASYAAAVALAGGTASLENAPANKVDLSGVNVSGAITGSIGFDLGLILPHICIPPVRACVDLGWFGEFCTPQYCITWPHADVSLNLPFAFNLDVSFGFRVDDLGAAQWGIVLLIDPFSPRFDLTPMGSLITAAIEAEVSSKLSGIPFIGPLLTDLINTAIGAFAGVLSLVIGVFSVLINAVLSMLDLLNVSVPFTLLTFDKQDRK